MEIYYKNILVPLDGSELAEVARTHAVRLTTLGDAALALLHILPPIEGVIAGTTPHATFVDEQQDVVEGRARRYLESLSERIGPNTATVHAVVKSGHLAETIIDYVNEHPVDLIVMSSHGHSGLQRCVLGSVADKVLRAADVPVLLVRAHEQHRGFEPR